MPSTQNKHLTTGGADPFLPVLLNAIHGARSIDMSVAFIRSTGLRLILGALHEAAERGVKVRILTGDYLSVTEPSALRSLLLLAEDGAEIFVYEADAKRSFHMKTYIFVTGSEGSAFIGSSNISESALKHGLEWNLRVDRKENPQRFDQILESFADLLSDAHVVPLSYDWIDAYEERYRGKDPFLPPQPGEDEKLPPPVPNPMQQEALAALHESRTKGDRRGLVVMATGLGKTWLAAFDVAATRSSRVLFVAHREEILLQAEETFLRIRPQARVGRYRAAEKETEAEMLFASVQTLGKAAHLKKFAPDHFDYIIVDEFHHAAARTYRQLLAHFEPKYLLGLTATPGRTDRADILALCDNNLVYERGLFEGVATELLCPFRYYGIGDHEVDYQAIPWRNGKFDPEALTNQLATVARAKHVIDSWRERKQKRTLAFCVSIRHADFMAEYFLSRSVRAASIHSRSERGRSQALAELEAGELDVVFSVDLFNEGVDLPAIDTVLMLRPTESQILFMQQLGRGLRRCPEVGKEHLVVVDFIGNHISFFRKMEAMHAIAATNQGRREFVEKIEAKQLSLPSGCFVNYDAKAIEFMKLLVQATGAKQRDRYCALFESLGRRPSMQEFHVAGGGLAAVRKEYGQWHSLVEQEGHLNTKQTEVFKANKSVLLHLETSSMTKSYKMVLLEAFSDLDGFSSPPTLGALAKRSFDIIRRRRQLWPDLPDLFRASFEDYEGIEKEWMGYWRKNPVRAWLGEKTQGDFAYFELRDDQFCYALELEQSHVEVLDELVTEVLDYRLQAYEERLASALDLIELVDAEEDTGVDIPYFSDLRIACGYFRSSEHESANVEFRRLPGRYGHLNPDRHFIARASGNSMDGGRSPVKDGDYLLLEMMSPDSAGSITGQVLAVEREDVSGDDQYVLRKVTKRADGTYVLVANNPDYQDFVATEEMRTIARFKSVIDPRDLALRTELMREDIPGLFGLAFNRGAWEAGHVCPKVISDQILLITLNKQGKQSEHQYHDYFLGPDTFHWQSQNSTIPTNKRGLGIINHEANGSAIHLFVRKTKLRAKTASPFYYLGQAVYESHKNSGPMDVIFKLKEPLSAGLAQYFGTTEHDA